MNTKSLFIFVLGAAAGSAVTWKYLKTKYERIAQEEIDSVKEVFSKRGTDEAEDEEEIRDVSENDISDKLTKKPDLFEYAAMVEKMNYANISMPNAKEDDEKEDDAMDENDPYIIAPEEVGDYDDYDTASLTYYADGVITNEEGVPMSSDDISLALGDIDPSSHFGEFEEDSVYVRNDILKTDYEILRDLDRYDAQDDSGDE